MRNGRITRQSVLTTPDCQGAPLNRIAPHIQGVGNTPGVLELGGVRMNVHQSGPLKIMKTLKGRQSVTTTPDCQGAPVNQIAQVTQGVGNTRGVLELGGVRMNVHQSGPLKFMRLKGRQSVTTTPDCQGAPVNQIAQVTQGVGNTPGVMGLGGVQTKDLPQLLDSYENGSMYIHCWCPGRSRKHSGQENP